MPEKLEKAVPTTIIYDDDEIRVIWAPGNSQFVLITFGDVIIQAKDHRFFADTPLMKLGISAIGIMAKRGNWYPQKSINNAFQRIFEKIDRYKIRIMYGGSMGGYAAIKFSALFGATHVISLCPQWSIDPEECQGIDPGWKNYLIPTMSGMGIRARDVAGEVFIFTDSFNTRDMFHYRNIIENYPDGHFINVPMVEHHVTTVFAGTANLHELIDACLASDLTALRKISRRIRKSHRIWKDQWLKHAMRKFPRIGIHFLLHEDNKEHLRKNLKYFPSILSYLATKISPQRAIDCYDAHWSLLTSPNQQYLICAYLADLVGGRVSIVTTHRSWLIYDLSNNRVIHKATPLDPWDIPVEAEIRGSTITLLAMVGGIRLCLARRDDGGLDFADSAGRGDERLLFEIKPDKNGLFTIAQDGKYLSAERTGSVACNRDCAKGWETFHFSLLKAPGITAN